LMTRMTPNVMARPMAVKTKMELKLRLFDRASPSAVVVMEISVKIWLPAWRERTRISWNGPAIRAHFKTTRLERR
jgi:hypothetical protein